MSKKFVAVILIFFAATTFVLADQTTNVIFAARAEAEFHRAQIELV